MNIKFRVYERATDKDVTDNGMWFLDEDGKLLHMDGDIIRSPVYVSIDYYYYKLEITSV